MAIAIIGVVTFLILVVSRRTLRSSVNAGTTGQPHWYELLLAAALLLAVCVIAVWQFTPGSEAAWADDGRAAAFFFVMMIIGGGALLLFVGSLFWRLTKSGEATTDRRARASAQTAAVPAPAKHPVPSATRLIGILGFAVCFLVLNWSHVSPEQRHVLMVNLIYPAGLIVALVMLFDKASRSWDIKPPVEALREWLYANALLVLYLVAYLNLLTVSEPVIYAGMFWDMVHVAGFLLILWILDRKVSRLRFLLLHGWIIALPVMLLIWQSQMGLASPEEVSWWDTVWPFFFLALAFFVIELIIIVASGDDGGQGPGMTKDVVFLVLYVILLISARPEPVA